MKQKKSFPCRKFLNTVDNQEKYATLMLKFYGLIKFTLDNPDNPDNMVYIL